MRADSDVSSVLNSTSGVCAAKGCLTPKTKPDEPHREADLTEHDRIGGRSTPSYGVRGMTRVWVSSTSRCSARLQLAVNRTGFGGGSHPRKDESCGSSEEVQRGVESRATRMALAASRDPATSTGRSRGSPTSSGFTRRRCGPGFGRPRLTAGCGPVRPVRRPRGSWSWNGRSASCGEPTRSSAYQAVFAAAELDRKIK